MNRDALMASIIGFSIGLVITGALLFGPRVFRNLPQLHMPAFTFSLPFGGGKEEETPPEEAEPELAPKDETPTIIASPLDGSIFFEDTVAVSGNVEPGSMVVVVGFDGEAVTTATAGTYEAELSLIEGRNDISVTAYEEGRPKTEHITVYYSQDEY